MDNNTQQQIVLNFTSIPEHVVAHTLWCVEWKRFSSYEYQEELRALHDVAQGLSAQWHGLLIASSQAALTSLLPDRPQRLPTELQLFCHTIAQSKAFAPIWHHTQAYLLWCQEQWERTYTTTSEYLHALTGLDLTGVFTVYVTHPSLRNGSYLGDNCIQWGHHEDWPHYSVVYLWHEILHAFFPPGDLTHALIQLLADNELRVRLNGGPTYPPFVGHARLDALMAAILPHWQAYLTQAHKDIWHFEHLLNDGNVTFPHRA